MALRQHKRAPLDGKNKYIFLKQGEVTWVDKARHIIFLNISVLSHQVNELTSKEHINLLL